MNSATAWIDGSAIYGTTRSETNALRYFKGGFLKSSDKEGLFPVLNNDYMSYFSPSRNFNENRKKISHLSNTFLYYLFRERKFFKYAF